MFIKNFSTKIKKKSVINLTIKAKERLLYLVNCKKDKNIAGIKLSVRNRGCNGKSYTLNYITNYEINNKEEKVNINDKLKLVIDNKALLSVIGTTIDYIDTPLASEFTFNNPNSKGECGCGESFHI